LLGKTTQLLVYPAVEVPSGHPITLSGLTPQSHLDAFLHLHWIHPPSTMYPKEHIRLQASGAVVPALVEETGVAPLLQVVGGASAQSQTWQPEESTLHPYAQIFALEQLIGGQALH